MTSAYKVEKAPIVAAASYVGPVFAVFADVWTFSDWPPITLAVVIGGGLRTVATRLDPSSDSGTTVENIQAGIEPMITLFLAG